ncbi:hypothetical protein EV363DRAFT_1151886, partial [Boletus edulis]
RYSPSSVQELYHISKIQAPFPSGQNRCRAIMMAYITRDPPVADTSVSTKWPTKTSNEQSCFHHIVRLCLLNRDGVWQRCRFRGQ